MVTLALQCALLQSHPYTTVLENERIVRTARPPGNHVQEGQFGITNYLHVYGMEVFAVYVCVVIHGGWLQAHVGTVNCTNYIWEPSNLIKLSLNHSLLSIVIRKLNVLMRK